MDKIVGPHDQGGGFLYVHIPGSKDLASYLSDALVYIPRIYRQDTGSRLIFFEIALRPAINAAQRN
jgi:hypothetical protein